MERRTHQEQNQQPVTSELDTAANFVLDKNGHVMVNEFGDPITPEELALQQMSENTASPAPERSVPNAVSNVDGAKIELLGKNLEATDVRRFLQDLLGSTEQNVKAVAPEPAKYTVVPFSAEPTMPPTQLAPDQRPYEPSEFELERNRERREREERERRELAEFVRRNQIAQGIIPIDTPSSSNLYDAQPYSSSEANMTDDDEDEDQNQQPAYQYALERRKAPRLHKRKVLIWMAATAVVLSGPYINSHKVGAEFAEQAGILPAVHPIKSTEYYVEDTAFSYLQLVPGVGMISGTK